MQIIELEDIKFSKEGYPFNLNIKGKGKAPNKLKVMGEHNIYDQIGQVWPQLILMFL